MKIQIPIYIEIFLLIGTFFGIALFASIIISNDIDQCIKNGGQPIIYYRSFGCSVPVNIFPSNLQWIQNDLQYIIPIILLIFIGIVIWKYYKNES